jgi:glycosyltransferase involved in cell wall biosynthesis
MRQLRQRGCESLILYLWRPEYGDAIEHGPWDLTCYHIDDEYNSDNPHEDTPLAEREVLRRTDQIFIHSPGLMEKKGGFNPHTQFVPNGVDFAAYSQPKQEPADLAPVSHPRVGYTGYLKRQLDWPLIADLVARHENWSFVFVGPCSPHDEVKPIIEQLARRKNAFFLGGKSPADLPAYVQHFDVCVMPYRRCAYSDYIYPLKLHEFLAAGKPVVAAPIRSLLGFKDTITLVEGPEAWSTAIAAALQDEGETSRDRHQERQGIASEFDWDRLVFDIASTMAKRLSPALSAQLSKSADCNGAASWASSRITTNALQQ